MPDITVFGLTAIHLDPRAPLIGSGLPNATLIEIQRWEDDGGALPPNTAPSTDVGCEADRANNSKDSVRRDIAMSHQADRKHQ